MLFKLSQFFVLVFFFFAGFFFLLASPYWCGMKARIKSIKMSSINSPDEHWFFFFFFCFHVAVFVARRKRRQSKRKKLQEHWRCVTFDRYIITYDHNDKPIKRNVALKGLNKSKQINWIQIIDRFSSCWMVWIRSHLVTVTCTVFSHSLQTECISH